jgi:hypothetical protein
MDFLNKILNLKMMIQKLKKLQLNILKVNRCLKMEIK